MLSCGRHTHRLLPRSNRNGSDNETPQRKDSCLQRLRVAINLLPEPGAAHRDVCASSHQSAQRRFRLGLIAFLVDLGSRRHAPHHATSLSLLAFMARECNRRRRQ